jgi:hypothetical protein
MAERAWPIVLGIDNDLELRLFYVDENHPGPPPSDFESEVLAQFQISIRTCGCENDSLKVSISSDGGQMDSSDEPLCVNTKIPCPKP